MAAYMITGEALYRMHRMKREMEAGGHKRSKWGLVLAVAFMAAWLLIGR